MLISNPTQREYANSSLSNKTLNSQNKIKFSPNINPFSSTEL